jgi:singapore isolate B (sub-type 7) whole genome shotgun sequence assembly, scaffold_1
LKKNVQLFSGIQNNCQAKVALSNGFVFSLHHSPRSYIHAKMLLNMKSFFSRNGVQWPELQWINTDSLIIPSDLPLVPEGTDSSIISP